LETAQGYYIANGVIVQNCRCTLVYGEPLTASAAPRAAAPRDFASWRDHAWEGDPVTAAAPSGVLYLIRHGMTAYDSDDHASDEIRGWADDPLDDRGRAEATQLAQALAGYGITALACSDLQRAEQTADTIAAALDLVAHPDRAYRPWNLGDLQGQTSETAAPEIARYVDAPDEPVPGGESFADFETRFLPALAALLARAQAGETLGLVTHSHNLKLARAWITNGRQHVTGRVFMQDAPCPASVLACTPEGDGWEVTEVISQAAPTAPVGAVPPGVHYRPATDPDRECAACEFYAAGHCRMFDADVIADYVCDEFVAKSPGAAVTSGGTMGDMLNDTTFKATGDTGLPLSERDRAWDASAATGRVKKWASSDGSGDPDKIDYSKLARAYFWQDTAGDGGPKIGDFKLPFADIIGGKLTAVWRGVTSGAQRLSATQGIDKAAVQAKMAAYYSKAAKAYGDTSIKPPWESGSAAADGERLAAMRAYLADYGADILEDDELRAHLLVFDALTATAAVEPVTLELSDITLTAASEGGPTQWQATLCVAGEPTVDNGIKRVLDVDGGSWLPLPLPLAIMDDSPHADVVTKSPVCGRIDQIWQAGNIVQASGIFLDDATDPKNQEIGARAAELVRERAITGISVDLCDSEVEMMVYSRAEMGPMSDPTAHNDPDGPGGPATEANLPNDIPEAAPIEEEPDWDDDLEMVAVFTRWVIAGATIVPVAALAPTATIAVVADAEGRFQWNGETEWKLPALTASAAGLAPLEPPREWFEVPEADQPTPLTVTDEGQVYGHLALWGTCHTGKPGVCVTAPRSPSGYRQFHRGQLKTAEGDRIDVGVLTMNTGHAGLRLNASATVAHYDDTGTQGAHVRASDGAHGIWLAGALNPKLSAEDARLLMASSPSGDWRELTRGDGLDLFGVLAVNVPGFPVARPAARMVASAEGMDRVALVAAGQLPDALTPAEFERQLAVLAASADGIEGLAALVSA